MASGTFNVATNNKYISGYVYWESTPNKDTNASALSMVLYLRRTNNYTGTTATYNFTGYFYCDGVVNTVSNSGKLTIPNNKEYVEIARTYYSYIKHNDDGTKTVPLGIETSSSNNSFTVPFVSTFVTLDTIPRESKPTCANVTLGSSTTIYTNSYSDTFTHEIFIKCDGQTIESFSGVGKTLSWSPSIASYAPVINTSPSKTFNIQCDTYQNGNYIGNSSCNVTLTVPNTVKPSVSIELSEADEFMNNLNWGIYVKGKSKLHVNIIGTPIYGSPINIYNSTVENTFSNNSTYETNYLSSAGLCVAEANVIDKRGNISNTISKNYNVIDYSKPRITRAEVTRCDSDGKENDEGTYLKCSFAGNISSVEGRNKATFKIGYKLKQDTNYEYITYVLESNTIVDIDYTNDSSLIIGNGNILATSSYDVIFVASDTFEETTIEKEVTTGFDLFNFHKSGKSLAIGKVSEPQNNEELLEIALVTKYFNKLIPKAINDYMFINLNESQYITSRSNVHFNNVLSSYGDSLTFVNNGIKIGPGVSKVRVDLTLWLESPNGTYSSTYILKNNQEVSRSIFPAMTSGERWKTITIFAYVDVLEGDMIYANAYFSTTNNENKVAGFYANSCNMSVQVIA